MEVLRGVSAPDALGDCFVERHYLSRGREPSVGAIGESIRFRRCAPGVEVGRGEERWIEFAASSAGVRIYARGAMESVAVVANEWPFQRAGAGVSILWGDPA